MLITTSFNLYLSCTKTKYFCKGGNYGLPWWHHDYLTFPLYTPFCGGSIGHLFLNKWPICLNYRLAVEMLWVTPHPFWTSKILVRYILLSVCLGLSQLSHSINFRAIYGAVCIQLSYLSYDDCENTCTLSYYHHHIGSMSHLPLFRVSSVHNGMRCLYIFIVEIDVGFCQNFPWFSFVFWLLAYSLSNWAPFRSLVELILKPMCCNKFFHWLRLQP